MKKITSIVAASLLLASCGRPQTFGTDKPRFYPTYGVFNEATIRSKNVCYEISVGNVVWSIILIETVIAPIYFVGFSLFNPKRLKRGPDDQCTVDDQ